MNKPKVFNSPSNRKPFLIIINTVSEKSFTMGWGESAVRIPKEIAAIYEKQEKITNRNARYSCFFLHSSYTNTHYNGSYLHFLYPFTDGLPRDFSSFAPTNGVITFACRRRESKRKAGKNVEGIELCT